MILALSAMLPFSYSPEASCDARSLITRHEGKENCVYKDTMGIPTIGIGYNLQNPGARSTINGLSGHPDYDDVLSGKTCLTDGQVKELFEPSYQSAVSGAKRAVSSYSSLCCDVQEVMTDMDYNLGDAGFSSFHEFISLINAGQWSEAAQDGKQTAWCRQVGSRCTEDMGRVAKGCGSPGPGPSPKPPPPPPKPPPPKPPPPPPKPPPPPPSPSGGCKACVSGGGGKACESKCKACGSACTACIEGGGGKACAERCC
jgi:GH24 family phage-related lysozyme (muramidase)